jgi:hypothetical protein
MAGPPTHARNVDSEFSYHTRVVRNPRPEASIYEFKQLVEINEVDGQIRGAIGVGQRSGHRSKVHEIFVDTLHQ